MNASATEESQERRPEAAPQVAGLAVWAAAMVLLPAQEPRQPVSPDPAMAAGIADHIWTCEEIAALLD